jgi:hypothetical protein
MTSTRSTFTLAPGLLLSALVLLRGHAAAKEELTMRLLKHWGLSLLAFLLIAGGLRHPNRLSADDELKPEAPPAPVKAVLDRYLKAIAAKDLKAMAALADVPWLDRDRQVVGDRTGLGKALQRVATQLPKDKGKRKVAAAARQAAAEAQAIRPDRAGG